MDETCRRVIFYLFDTPGLVRWFERSSLAAERSEFGLTTVCVITDDVVSTSYRNAAFDHVVVLPATTQQGDPSLLDTEQTVLAVADIIARLGVGPESVKVIGCGEYTIIVAAAVRTTLGIDGPSMAVAEAFRNKVTMKRRAAAQVSVPRYCAFDRARFTEDRQRYFDELATRLGVPFVIKPTNMSSSVGVYRIGSVEELGAIEPSVTEHDGEFEVEEFIRGDQYHCETIYHEGRRILSFVSRFNASQLEMMRGKAVGTMPVRPSDPLSVLVGDAADRASRALGARDGLTHTELIVRDGNEVVFIESGARSPGGDVIGRYIDTFGVNILEVDWRIQSGVPYDLTLESCTEFSFWAFAARPSGTVTKLNTPSLSSSITVDWFISPGDVISRSTSFEEPAALITGRNSDYDALSADFRSILDFQFITVS